jgi:TRAP-type C4-dicarboxylate transport system permease small subunit
VAPAARKAMQWGVHACMTAIAVFMLGYGVVLCRATWGNTVAEFPSLSVGLVYLPIPLGGLLTLLFILEKVWLGDPPKDDVMYSDQPADLE